MTPILKGSTHMIIEEIRTIDELLQFVNSLYQKHGLRMWYRGVEDAGQIGRAHV